MPAFSSDDKSILLEAIQRLCSSLEPEIAIGSFFDYIAQHLPLACFTLLSSSPENLHPHEVIHVAQVSQAGCNCPMTKLSLSGAAKKLAKQLGLDEAGSFTECLITSSSDAAHIYFQSLFPQPATPVFVLRLMKEHSLGTAHFAASSTFSPQHLDLMRGLEPSLCIAMGNLLQHRELVEMKSNILMDNQRLRLQLQGLDHVEIIGANNGLKDTMRKVRQVGPIEVPVLITGETGTGKELIARALHELSPRKGKDFIAVNCGALPPSLLDSELFGYTRGSFTGATENRKGYFEQAQGGTLFLDEIGELPLEAQARLLRVLEHHEMNKIGGSAPIKLDIRLLAATNRDLPNMIAEGTFRKDLYYRLRVVSIDLPPLRQRKNDIPELTQFLLRRSAARFGVPVPTLFEGDLKQLLAHNWPGNIRELQNMLEEALICSNKQVLHLEALSPKTEDSFMPEHLPQKANTPHNDLSELENFGYEALLREYFGALLLRTQGRISGPHGAAQKAGLKPGTFRFKCAQLGLLPESPSRIKNSRV